MIATEDTHKLVEAFAKKTKAKSDVFSSALSPPLGKPFTLGSHRLELFSSGLGLGGASLVADIGEKRIAYAGTVNPENDTEGVRADIRHCDTLVIDGEYADSHYSFPKIQAAADQAAETCQQVSSATNKAGIVVLLVRTKTKSLQVAAALHQRGIALRAHRRFYSLLKNSAGRFAPSEIRLAPPKLKPGTVVIWPADARSALEKQSLPPGSKIILLSGRAKDLAFVHKLQIHDAIPWSQKADCDALVEYIKATGAATVHFLSSQYNSSWDRLGLDVFPLGPPKQMALF